MLGMPSDVTPDSLTSFFECATEDAEAQLTRIADALNHAGAEVQWLISIDQPELRLLIARGSARALSVEASEPVRHWRFRSGRP